MVTVNSGSGGPNVIGKSYGSRAAFAKVTRSKWLLDLWAVGSGVCGLQFAGARPLLLLLY